MIKKKLILIKKPPDNLVNKIAKAIDIAVKYPNIAKAKYNDESGLSNVAWIYDTCRNITVIKLLDFMTYIDSGGDLYNRSWYLMVDTYKIAAYLYELRAESIISDNSFDRLGAYLEKNIPALKEYDIIPNIISEESISGDTGMAVAYTLSAKDIALAEHLLIVKRNLSNENKKEISKQDVNESKSRGDVRSSPTHTEVHGTEVGKRKFIIKRPIKK